MTSSLAPKQIEFKLVSKDGTKRKGQISTAHGVIETPVFMPVGTQSTVKAMTWDQLDAVGTEIVLANTYHLHLRPGEDLIAKAGGLHKWTNYNRPFLTDSGGFQIFSQARIDKCKITDAGAEFIDHHDGSRHFIGPRESMQIQHKLGADIIMAFDHCPPGQVTWAEAKDAMERTHRWAEICVAEHNVILSAAKDPFWLAAQKRDVSHLSAIPREAKDLYAPSLFLIVQGGIYKDLRQESARVITSMQASGYAIGGVSVGESRDDIDEIVRFTTPLLPENKPRYLMGIGTHEDVLKAIDVGIDMFDCVMPTRIARHGCFFAADGSRQLIKAERYREDFSPLIEGCTCYTCANHSKAYIRHLWRAGETVSGTLLSIHNLHYLIDLTKRHVA